MNSLINFDYQERPVRVITDETGAPWWVARDVCEILEIKNTNMATQNLDDDEKLLSTLLSAGQERQVITVNESGLYTLIIRSNKPEAKKFRKWITGEVLPAIRKNGRYEIPEAPALPVEADSQGLSVSRLSEAAQGVKAAMIMARAFGFKDEDARKMANALVRRITGLDSLDLLGVSPEDLEEGTDPLFSDFAADRLEEEKGSRMRALDMYREFVGWCDESGIVAPSMKAAGMLAGEVFKRAKIEGRMYYLGVRLKD